MSSSRKPANLTPLAWPAAGVLLGALITTTLAGPRPFPLYAGVAFWFVDMAIVAALSARPTGARFAALLSGLCLAIPFFMDAASFSRFLLECFLALPLGGAVNLMLVPPIHGFRARLGFMGTWGIRLPQRRPRSFDSAALLQLLVATAVFAAAIAAVKAAPTAGLWLPLRWFAGGIATLAFAEMATACPNLLMAALAIRVPPFMQSPWRSASVGEFWTKRWNIAASEIFHRFFFAPLARHGPAFAMFMTFAISGVGHTLLANLALGSWPVSVACGAFFLVQPLYIVAERALNVRRWPGAAARAWTLTMLTLSSPLFIEPALQIIEPSWNPPNSVLLSTAAALGIVVVASAILTMLPALAARQPDGPAPALLT